MQIADSQTQVNPYASVPAGAASPVYRVEHRESMLTRLIEQQSAKIPSNVFLVASFAAMGISLAAELAERPRLSRFVGMWVGPLLTMGVYNKLVKTLGTR